MFYYLLARNLNITKNFEEVTSITVLKYLFLIAIIKIIEYKYFEIGFFTSFILAMIILDIIFSLYHIYSVSMNEDNNIFWNDDVVNENFSESEFRNEINEIRNDFLKRKFNKINISNNINLSEINTDLKSIDISNNIKLSEINTDSTSMKTDELENAINNIINDHEKIDSCKKENSKSDEKVNNNYN